MSYVRLASPLAGAEVDVFYRDLGSGAPLLVLHGGWGYGFYPFDPLPGFRYVIPDRTGYGRSPRLAEFPRPFHALAAREHAAMLDALGIARCAVWGHSDGAVIAAHMAIAEPQRFTHVILEALHVDREKPRSRAFFTMMAEAPDDFGPRVTERLAAEHGETWRMPIQADGRVWLELAQTPGTLFDAHALEPPTLVITGSDDPRREPGELATFGDRVVEIAGGSHAPHSERVVKDRTAEIAGAFLGRESDLANAASLAVLPMPGLMRLAHFSDLHLLSHDGARWLELANKRWIGAMNLLSNRSRHYHVTAFEDMVTDLNTLGVDHILCTGDVTNLALRKEFAFARERFDKLALGPIHTTVIPGNHDAYVAEGIPLFGELFADYATTDPGWEWSEADKVDELDDLKWPIIRVRGNLALIGTSTSRATPWFTAYGRLGLGQLGRLKSVLSDPRLAGKFRLVAIHHPPAGKRAESRIRGLRDHQAFARVIAECGADLIVHGHEHRDMTEALDGPSGPVPVRGVASGTYLHNKPEKTARYRIYEIADGRIVSDHVRIWNRDEHRFDVEPT